MNDRFRVVALIYTLNFYNVAIFNYSAHYRYILKMLDGPSRTKRHVLHFIKRGQFNIQPIKFAFCSKRNLYFYLYISNSKLNARCSGNYFSSTFKREIKQVLDLVLVSLDFCYFFLVDHCQVF